MVSKSQKRNTRNITNSKQRQGKEAIHDLLQTSDENKSKNNNTFTGSFVFIETNRCFLGYWVVLLTDFKHNWT